MNRIVLIGCLISVFISCQNQNKKTEKKEATAFIGMQVKELSKLLNQNLEENYVINLDHHLMAKEEGAYTPPAIATIFSDPAINTDLIKQDPLIGIDLPFKILCYTEADTSNVSVAYTSAAFIEKRHGIQQSLLQNYKIRIDEVLGDLGSVQVSETKLDSVYKEYGIISIKSDFGYEETVSNLKAIVAAQNDTRWFGEIDFQKDSKALGVEINPVTLLMFGGPAPGAKAMSGTPKIGLDAFCQKLLVYQNEKDEICVAFNDIVAFSKLYYGVSTKPQEMINKRLTATFTKAVKRPI